MAAQPEAGSAFVVYHIRARLTNAVGLCNIFRRGRVKISIAARPVALTADLCYTESPLFHLYEPLEEAA